MIRNAWSFLLSCIYVYLHLCSEAIIGEMKKGQAVVTNLVMFQVAGDSP
jgi:hypothetical protein